MLKGEGLPQDLVETASGTIRGAYDDGVWAFKGVPYGADTARGARFLPPRPPVPWPGIRECLTYGPSCPQMTIEQMTGVAVPPEVETMMGVLTSEPSMSEDCLALNVWTPTLDGRERLPVLVWLHGGGLSTGSASWPLYDFTNLARRDRVVMIGINHRLGVLGFLDLSQFGDEYADSGNVGMLDVVAALGWVAENIGGFGGDPTNVTVFGESGGGAKTTALLAMPAASGLFHKAFPMSGSMLAAQSTEQAQSTSELTLKHLEVGADLKALQTVEIGQLIEAERALQGAGLVGTGRGRTFGPVLGASLPQHPQHAIELGIAANIPLVSGCTTDEMMAFLIGDPEFWSITEQGLRDRVKTFLGESTDPIIAGYRAIRPDDTPTSLLIAITSDATMRIPHVRLSEAKLAGGGAPTWMYSFAWGHPDPTGRVRSGHGSDMPYFFDNVDKASLAAGPHAVPLVTATSRALTAFAYSGDPNHDELPEWPSYTLEVRSTMRFDTPSLVEADPNGVERLCWDGVPLGGL
jgi:para-nitrobenzyl esterase